MSGVHIQNHQFVTYCSEDDLFVAQPLTAEHLVHAGLRHVVLLHHHVAQHVPRSVLRGHPHVLELPITTSLSVHDTINKITRNAVTWFIR